jgi:hypothetical protein
VSNGLQPSSCFCVSSQHDAGANKLSLGRNCDRMTASYLDMRTAYADFTRAAVALLETGDSPLLFVSVGVKRALFSLHLNGPNSGIVVRGDHRCLRILFSAVATSQALKTV